MRRPADKQLLGRSTRAVKIDSRQLANLMLEVANQRFGANPFRRREFMVATEQEVRRRGLWTRQDDVMSGSVDPKSVGLADIDYRVSDLAKWGDIVRVRTGIWRLASPKAPTPKEFLKPPSDLVEQSQRTDIHVSRIIRDTQASRALKALYEFHCQVCGLRIEPLPGTFYIEVHHIRPLGGEHSGPDIPSNMLVLCPNHHAMFDFGMPRFTSEHAIEIDGTSYQLTLRHQLAADIIKYHNESLHNRTS